MWREERGRRTKNDLGVVALARSVGSTTSRPMERKSKALFGILG